VPRPKSPGTTLPASWPWAEIRTEDSQPLIGADVALGALADHFNPPLTAVSQPIHDPGPAGAGLPGRGHEYMISIRSRRRSSSSGCCRPSSHPRTWPGLL
jgi:hypothetical protein